MTTEFKEWRGYSNGNPYGRAVKASVVAEILGVHVNTVKRIPIEDLPYFTMGSRGDRKYQVEHVLAYRQRRRAAAPVRFHALVDRPGETF